MPVIEMGGKKTDKIDFECIFTHTLTLLFHDFVYFSLFVMCRLDNVSDVMDDSVISSMMPAPGRTLDGDELIDDV